MGKKPHQKGVEERMFEERLQAIEKLDRRLRRGERIRGGGQRSHGAKVPRFTADGTQQTDKCRVLYTQCEYAYCTCTSTRSKRTGNATQEHYSATATRTAIARETQLEREHRLEAVAAHERVHRRLQRVDHQRGRAVDEQLLLARGLVLVAAGRGEEAACGLLGAREGHQTAQGARDAVQWVRVPREQLEPRVQAILSIIK